MRRKLTEQSFKCLGKRGLSALVFCFLLTSCFGPGRFLANKTVLKVNDTEVSTQEFAEQLALRLKGYDALHAKDVGVLKRAKEQTVQKLIFEIIARDFTARNNLSISKKELEEEVERIRRRYPDDNAFRRSLADENIPLERWRHELEFTLLQKKIVAHLMAKAPEPTEAELQAYYEENKKVFERPARIQLRQIVVEKEDNAKRILDELNNNAQFADLARKFSVAPEGENGGLTDWIEKGTLEVFDNAFKLAVGTRSKIVKSPYGWHIYEVVKKEPEGRLSFEQAKAKIRTLVMERKEQGIFSAWLEEQVRKSSVFRNDALIESIQVTTRGT